MAVRLAIFGVGNVASALLQGVTLAQHRGEPLTGVCPGLSIPPSCKIEIACAFDVAPSKIGVDLACAAREYPNCTEARVEVDELGVKVLPGHLFDVPGPHLSRILRVDRNSGGVNIASALSSSKANVAVILIPSGFNKTAHYYAKEAIRAGCCIVNGMAASIAKSAELAMLAARGGVTLVGDDVRSQMGATVLHQRLNALFGERGAKLQRSFQFDWGGDADFMNLACDGMYSGGGKKEAKSRAVENAAPNSGAEVHLGAVDWVPFLNGQKEAFIRSEGLIFGDAPVKVEIRLTVEDAFNSAGVLVDAVRTAYLAREAGEKGVIPAASSLFCKSPPTYISDEQAREMLLAMVQRTA